MSGDVEEQTGHGVEVPPEPYTEQTSQTTVEQLLKLPSVWDRDAEIQWLIEGMIPLHGVTLLSAESGTGKTWLAYAIAGAVAHGKDFLGLTTKQRRVIYMDGENPLAVVKRNLTDLGIGRVDNLHIWGGWNDKPPEGPKEDMFLKLALAEQPLLIWDSLVHFNEGDEQASKEVRKFMNYFRKLTSAGATVLGLHNTGKAHSSKEYRGSSDIKASVDMAYCLQGTPKNGEIHQLTMRNFKSRFKPGDNFGLQFEKGDGFIRIDVPQADQKVSVEDVVLKIISEHPGLNRGGIWDLAKPMGVGRNAVYAFLDTLPSHKGNGTAKHYYAEDIPALQERRDAA